MYKSTLLKSRIRLEREFSFGKGLRLSTGDTDRDVQ